METLSWPARSPDPAPRDFLLYGYLKDKVYRNCPKSIDQLKAVLWQEIAAAPQGMTRRVMQLCVKNRDKWK